MSGELAAALDEVRQLAQRGARDAAAARLEAALARDPSADAATLGRAAGLALSLGAPPLALAIARRFVAVAPDQAGSHHALGLALAQAGEPRAAAAALRAALARAPGVAMLEHHLAEVLLAAGDASGAIAVAGARLAIDPDDEAARWLRGTARLQAGDGAGAEVDFEWLLARRPESPDAWRGLAEALELQGWLERSQAARRREVALDPQRAERRRELGIALARHGDTAAARAELDAALALDPSDLRARWARWQCLPLLYASAAEIAAERAAWLEELGRLEALDVATLSREQLAETLPVQSNFFVHYQGGELLPLQRRYAALLSRWATRLAPAPRHRAAPRRAGRLRVGFASAFLRRHTVFDLFRQWLAGLDRRRFEVVAFHLGLVRDEVTAGLGTIADETHVEQRSLEAWRETLAAADLDALIWLDLGMDGIAQVLATARYAPLTAVAWGHPVTTGLATVDCFLSGAAMEIDAAESHYSERLVRLPGLGIAVAPPPGSEDFVRRPLDPATPRLLCAQSVFKILPDSQDLLAQLAARLPTARFEFVPHPVPGVQDAFRARMRAAFAARGVDFDACATVHPYLPRPAFVARMQAADLLLDVLGWSGGHTTLEGLAVDLPVVTCPGPFMRSRHSHGMLAMLGLDTALSAPTPEAWLDTVTALATDRARHAATVAAIAARKRVLFGHDAAAALGDWLWQACGRA